MQLLATLVHKYNTQGLINAKSYPYQPYQQHPLFKMKYELKSLSAIGMEIKVMPYIFTVDL